MYLLVLKKSSRIQFDFLMELLCIKFLFQIAFKAQEYTQFIAFLKQESIPTFIKSIELPFIYQFT